MKLIIFSLQGLGNCILNLPFIKSLKKEYEKIDLVVPQNGAHIFYKYSLFIDKLIPMSQYFKQCRKTSYNLALTTFPNLRRENTFLFLTKAKQKICYTMDNDYYKLLYFLNRSKIKPEPSLHDLENTCNLIGVKPDLNITFDDISSKKIDYLNYNCTEPYIAMHFTSSTQSKRIAYNEVAETIDKILDNKDLGINNIYLLGTNSELNINFSIKELVHCSFKQRIIIPANLSILETSKIISNCSYFIGLDSALAHIAALFKRPSIIIWSFAKLSRIYPYNPNAHILMNSKINQIYIFKGDYPDDILLKEQMSKYKADHIINILLKEITPNGYINSQNNFRIPLYDLSQNIS